MKLIYSLKETQTISILMILFLNMHAHHDSLFIPHREGVFSFFQKKEENEPFPIPLL